MLRTTLLIVVALGFSLTACEPNNQGYAPKQPITYSHGVHAGALQIECLYCHFAAERGRYAGIPPAAVCMNCHSMVATDHPEVQKIAAAVENNEPIRWVRVHWLPDHAYFNHSAHVNNGVACQTCHGPVEQMGRLEQWAPLTMGWCVNCHRDNVPKDIASAPGASQQSNRLTDCVTCHR